MITLAFLGVGSAFAKRNFNSNFILETWKDGEPDDLMLVDFGLTGPVALWELSGREGFGHLRSDNGMLFGATIPKVYVSHQHGDHAAGLEEMALTNYFVHGYRPELYGAPEVLEAVWEHSLRAGCDTLPGRKAELSDFFDPRPRTYSLRLGEYEIRPFRTDHVRTFQRHDWPSYGMVVHGPEGKTAFVSGDSRLDPEYGGIMERAEVCFHDCSLVALRDLPHASLWDLGLLPERTKAKTYLYHYGDNFDDASLQPEIARFAGLAKPAVRYTLLP